jgi:hypothetical protein
VKLLRAILCAALAAGLLPPSAPAAPYTVWSCRDAQGGPLPTAAWLPAGNTGTRADTCAAGGALSVVLGAADTAPGAISGYRFDRPAGVTITGYTAWLAAETAAVPASPAEYAAGLGQGDELSVPTVLDGCGTAAPACSSGTFDEPLDLANRRSLGVVFGGLALVAACSSPTSSCAPDADPPARAALFRSAVELDDPSPPVVAPVGGTIAVAVVTGIRTVVAEVRDEGSGVHSTELLVDGRIADRQDGSGTCAPPYTVADPCPRSMRATFVLDTGALPEGEHQVAIRAADAALNTAVGAATAITVAHPEPPGTIAPDPPVLRLRVPKRIGLPSGASVTGTAVGADGATRAGVPLRFQRRPFGGTEAEWRDIGASTVSDIAGRFRMPRPPASAQVRVLVASTAFAAAPATTAFVERLKATIRASAKSLRNGQRLTLTGRLRGAGGAADGRTVLIQSRVRGRWRAVDSVRSRGAGRIVWRYRFTNTRRTARYRFRFVVPRTEPLPWNRLTTHQVRVLVRAV